MSQFGEHMILKAYMDFLGVQEGKLVDVGAFRKILSNSFFLLQNGWHGLLVDATPQNVSIMLKDFQGLDARCVCAAISDKAGVAELHLHQHPGHNSLLETWHPVNKLNATIWLLTCTLESLLREMDVPVDFDVLSIDTEGMDAKIMAKFFESTYRPKVIVTEAESYKGDYSMYLAAGYSLMGMTGPATNPYGNAFFTRMQLPPDDFYIRTTLRRP